MAGTGDVDLLRYLRIAHGNCDHQTSFGTHMATHMALGMLFLGGGRFTLGSSDSAVAALLVAFFPRFQTAVHDNRAHLQACRHLWVLAVEPRLLVAEDVDSHEVSYLPVKVMHTDPENNDVSSVASHEIKTPALLPYFQSIRSLETVSLRYWPASLQVSTNTAHAKALLSMRTMFVKRKTGHLSYADDPKGNRSIFARSSAAAMFDIDMTTSARNGPSLTDLRDLVHGFPMAPQYAAFVERICSPSKRSNSDENGQAFQSFCTSVLMECLTQDKPALVPIYLALYLGREGGTSAQGSAMFLRDLEFAAGFYASDYERLIPAGSSERHKPLVQKVLLDNLLLASKGLAKEIMHSPDVAAGDLSSMSAHSALLAYLGEALGDTLAAAKALSPTSSSPSSDRANSNTVARQLAYILNVERVPSLETLRSLRTLVTEARSQSLKLTTEAGGLGAHDDPSALDEGIRLVVRLAVMNLEKESSQDSVGVGEKSVAIEPQPWTNRLLDEMLKLWQ